MVRLRTAYAPAAGRLAAAMATMSARRRPIRDRVERSNAPNCRIRVSLRAGRNKRSPNEERALKNGAVRKLCRWDDENSNAATVRPLIHSGFITASRSATVEIFSAKLHRVAHDARVRNTLCRGKPESPLEALGIVAPNFRVNDAR